MTTKFTTQFKSILAYAKILAATDQHTEVTNEHVLEALSNTRGSLAFELMHKLGMVDITDTNEQSNKSSLSAITSETETLQISGSVKQAIQHAVLLAAQFDHQYVGTEHLLLSILDLNHSGVNTFLSSRNFSRDDLMGQLEAVLKNTTKFGDLTSAFSSRESGKDFTAPPPSKVRKPNSGAPEERILDFFATNLTDQQFQERINPVVGREAEIERVIQIISRKDKNNPVLLGEPGVGKTAIIEGLAKRVVEGTVPHVLQRKKIYSLDLSLLIAGAMYRGEFEGRMKQLLEEVRDDENIILFIDEIHTLVGAGAAAGSLDAANILKPALARGEIRLIGATTPDEYKKHIEPDSALERRLQVVAVPEPTVAETKHILKGIRAGYETYHGIAISNGAITAAAELSARYLSEKFLPDKAIDLIDEAAAKKKVALTPSSELQQINALERELEQIVGQKRSAVEQEDFPTALSLKEQERTMRASLDALLEEVHGETEQLHGEITEHDIAELISQITGIPVGELVASDIKQLKALEKQMSKKIIGQSRALTALARAIKRSKVGLASPDRPLGSFIFLGPSGVGKTETAKILAQEVFNDDKSLIRFDMSEFSSGFNVSRLIGSPAGYVGFKEGGQLTEAVRRNPYSVILFDEIEKAHRDIFNVLLQILDEGHLTDAAGKRVDFKNTIIILTSNIGLSEFNHAAELGFTSDEGKKKTPNYHSIEASVLKSLRKQFRPEFLNRLDNVIVYEPLTKQDVKKIVALEMKKITKQAKEREIHIAADKELLNLVAEKSFTPREGARAVRKTVQDLVVAPLADKLLAGDVHKGTTISVGVKEDKIHFS